MSEQTTEAETQETAPPQKPATLEELLSDVDEDKRNAVLSQVSKARKDAAEYRRKLAEAKPLIEAAQQARESGKTELEKAQEVISGGVERESALRNRLVSATVRALASASFNDPEDAIAYLDLGSYVDVDGNVDEDAIAGALDELLNRKPHFRKAEDAPGARRPAPDRSQGSGAQSGSSTALNGDPLLDSVKSLLGIRPG